MKVKDLIGFLLKYNYEDDVFAFLFDKGDFVDCDFFVDKDYILPVLNLKKKMRGQRMNNKSFGELKELVLEWADDKDLLHEENAEKQFMKFIEEVFEFNFETEKSKNYEDVCHHLKIEGSLAKTRNKRDMMLEMGDIFVTLIILCEDLEIDPVVCLEMAYKKISKRQGKTINGNFVKSEDLV